MNGRWWRTLVADPRHGPLPAMLLGLAAASGMVDAVAFLSLGRVFVANMTGNVAFIGLALARAPGFSFIASVVALAGFLLGAAFGGATARRLAGDRAVLLAAGTGVELILIAGAALLAGLVGEPFGSGSAEALAALGALAMGTQNAVVRRLGVPDLATNVMTTTLTGMASDVGQEDRRRTLPRQFLSVVTLAGGALFGAELDLHAGAMAALAVLGGLLAAVAAAAAVAARRPGDWRWSGGAGASPARPRSS